MSWIRSAKDMQQEEAEQRAANARPDRFWMKKHTTHDLVLVDDIVDAACIFEHQYKANASWKNWMTCTDEPDSVCCEELDRNKRSAVYYVTMVDMEKWEDKRKNVHQFELKLFPAKWSTFEKLETKSRERGGLAMHVVKARRFGEQRSPGVGDEHEIQRLVESPDGLWRVANYLGKKLPDLWSEAEADPKKMEQLKLVFQLEFDSEGKLVKKVVPFNYNEILAPPSTDLARKLLGRLDDMSDSGKEGSKSSSSGSSSSGDADEDDIPF